MIRTVFFLFLLISITGYGQEVAPMSFSEYLGYVKRYHPVVKQANLNIDMAQAELIKARGGFDPKIEVDYDRKKFKESEYYDILNASFKIPTWYGIELKAGFEDNEGIFLNPQNTVPIDGQYSAGISFSLGQGLFINERMATLKRAKIFIDQSEAIRDLQVNEVLFQAANAYFNWARSYNELQVFENFLGNAVIRANGIKSAVIQGDLAAIDSLEAGITVSNRQLNLEQARLSFLKEGLQLATFLWLEGNIPVELQPQVIPADVDGSEVDRILEIDNLFLEAYQIEEHPKVQSLDFKVQSLEVDRRLKANKLLPQLDLSYDFINDAADNLNGFNTADYKVGVNFSFPIFLRKERGDLNLAKVKLQDAQFELVSSTLQLQNKIRAIDNEIQSLDRQIALINSIVEDYQTLLTAEERKFGIGESSVFLINSRERTLIDARLKLIALQNKSLLAKASLFNQLAINPDNL